MIWSIIAGILAGFIASKLTDGSGKGCIIDLVLGIIGGALGGWLFELLDISWGGVIGQIGTAVIGAVIFLFLWKKLTK